MPVDGIRFYRRTLPHWRVSDATYFVTWRVDCTRAELDMTDRDAVVASLRKFDGARYELLAYVVMNDHVHVIVTPRPGLDLERLVHSWKSYTAHCLSRRSEPGRVWQSEYFDRVIRNETELREKIDYILANPFQRWPDIEAYRWVWVRERGDE